MKKKTRVLEAIGPDEALIVLNELVAGDTAVRKSAEEIALKVVAEVDVEAVAEDVFWELDSIAVEDVWDNSGATRDGYIDPGDYAWQLFQDSLKPFLERLRRCHELSLTNEAKLQCMGILKGICRFEAESTSEFKDWAADAPGENFVAVFEEWKKLSKSKKDVSEVSTLVQTLCPGRAKFCK